MFQKNHEYDNVLDQPIAKVIDEWIEVFFDNSDHADSTKALYVNNYKKYFRTNQIGMIPLKDVNAKAIQKFYNGSYAKRSSLKAINKLLGNFYQYCEVNGICDDATRSVKVPAESNTTVLHTIEEIEVWTDNDLKKVISALSGTKLRFLVILAVNSGARFGELLALTYDDIQGNTLTINKQITEVAYGDRKGARLAKTKSASSNRKIELSDEVIEELVKHQQIHNAEMMRKGYETEIIFSTEIGTYSNKTTIRRMLNKVYKKIGVPQHTFHSFRHTYGTNLSRAGVPIERTSKLMGHSSTEVTQKYYINVGQEEMQDAACKIVHFSLEAHKKSS